MKKFVALRTGIGTPSQSTTYYGPFNGETETDSFVEKVRQEASKSHVTSSFGLLVVDDVPNGWSAIPHEGFQGFMQV